MRDISRKSNTLRTAVARGTLEVAPAAIEAIRAGAVPKGNPLEVAKVAGIQAAKRTSQLIPYCHQIPLAFADVAFDVGPGAIEVTATVKAIHGTGVEMEALAAASVAALTLYDMLKMLDEHMEIRSIRLVEKRGGKSSFARRLAAPRRAGVLVVSDSVASGAREDRSGRLIAETLAGQGFAVAHSGVVPDDIEAIAAALKRCADDLALDLVVTAGGTGLGPRDVTPEATARVIEREAPGMAEAARSHGQTRTPHAMLSRGLAGLRGKTLIINLPGSPAGVMESLDGLFPGILHAFSMIEGKGHEPETQESEPEVKAEEPEARERGAKET